MNEIKKINHEFLTLLEGFNVDISPALDPPDDNSDRSFKNNVVRAKNDIFSMYLTTDGAASFGDNSDSLSNFMVASNLKKPIKILDMAHFYHSTKRSLNYADIIKIGTRGDPFGLFVSVPFFLPPQINVVKHSGLTLLLKWLMPINKAEYDYIEHFGPDKFEEKLFLSEYDYFEERSDISYLENNF